MTISMKRKPENILLIEEDIKPDRNARRFVNEAGPIYRRGTHYRPICTYMYMYFYLKKNARRVSQQPQ